MSVVTPTPDQRYRERSIATGLALDGLTFTLFLVIAWITGSVTMVAELVRAALMNTIEVFSLVMLRRIHRGRTVALEFGSGKLEQLVNLIVALGMLVGAAWIVYDVVRLLTGLRPVSSSSNFALAAGAATVNTIQNFIAWRSVRRAARSGGSVIMEGQLRARSVKLVSSLIVQGMLTLATFTGTRAADAWFDGGAALLVAVFIVYNAIGLMRTGIPDLIDHSVAEEVHQTINRTLARHFDDYDQIGRIRTRRSGEVIHTEIELGFRADLPLGEVTARMDAMKASLRTDLKNVDVSIVPKAVPK